MYKRIKWYAHSKRHEMVIFKSPFRGRFAWEMQIGPIVLHWMHSGNKFKSTKGIGNFRFWFDSAWII